MRSDRSCESMAPVHCPHCPSLSPELIRKFVSLALAAAFRKNNTSVGTEIRKVKIEFAFFLLTTPVEFILNWPLYRVAKETIS